MPKTHNLPNLQIIFSIFTAPNTTDSDLYNNLELLMMGIVVPETCWTSNTICNKNHLLHLVGILFPHIKDDTRSKSHKIFMEISYSTLFFLMIADLMLCYFVINSDSY